LVEFGKFLATLWWPLHFLMMAVFLGLVWILARFNKRLTPFTGQLMVLAGIFWIGLIFFIITFSFPPPSPILRAVTDASTIPRVWFYALCVAVVLSVIPIVTGKNDPDLKFGNIRRLTLVIATLVIGVSLINIIGYYISMAVVTAVIMWLLGSRNKIELISVPIGWVLFSYFVFARLLNVRLPVGIIFSGIFR